MAAPREARSDLRAAMAKNGHLAEHVAAWRKSTGSMPRFEANLPWDLRAAESVDVIYPVGDPIFIHVSGAPGKTMKYHVIEPSLSDAERPLLAKVREQILLKAPFEDAPEDPEALRGVLDKLFGMSITIDDSGDGGRGGLLARIRALWDKRRIALTTEQHARMRYFLHRDIVDHGPLEPLIRDPYIEDIHAIGLEPVRNVHKVFDLVETNVRFRDSRELNDFLRTMAERIGRPVSESKPIVDATLPDGSRINIVYSDDVSLKGPSFTIRKFSEQPPSITQLIKWGTISPHAAAYLWLCLEHGQSVFICGETASGKTTTLNAILPFIRPSQKVFTAEDTPEVRAPQPTWQQLSTRDQGPTEGRVDMFQLLRAGLRSRPNYIIVGEIRGPEGAVAFQAMQTGHPVLATFHASSVRKMIQRLSSEPINVPVTFMDNLNVALIQMAVYHRGKMLRRVLGLQEIEGYTERAGGVLTRGVFEWDPTDDNIRFRGRNNSYVLEERIAKTAGYLDKRDIYRELDLRARLLERAVEADITEYHAVKELIWAFYRDGVRAMPFTV